MGLLVLETSEKQKNGLPIFLFSLLFPIVISRPFMVSTLYFQKFKIHPLSVFVCAPHCPFLFAHTLLACWNSGMATKTKIVQRRACRTCFVWEVSVLYTKNVRLTIHHSVLFFFVLFFLTTKAGFANIFEIKCSCFFKLN